MTCKLEVSEFLNYLRAFNARDYETQHSFYASGAELVVPDADIGTLKGSDAIMEHYRPIHKNAVEKVIPLIVMSDRGRIFMQMEAYFVYQNEVAKAVHDYHVHPGDVIKIDNCAVYDLDAEGKMKRITCHLFKQELLGQVDIKEKIRETESRADTDLRLYNYEEE